jgi:hypothetical protein
LLFAATDLLLPAVLGSRSDAQGGSQPLDENSTQLSQVVVMTPVTSVWPEKCGRVTSNVKLPAFADDPMLRAKTHPATMLTFAFTVSHLSTRPPQNDGNPAQFARRDPSLPLFIRRMSVGA